MPTVLEEQEKIKAQESNSRIKENYRTLLYGDATELQNNLVHRDYQSDLRRASTVIPKSKSTIRFDENAGATAVNNAAPTQSAERTASKNYFSANPYATARVEAQPARTVNREAAISRTANEAYVRPTSQVSTLRPVQRSANAVRNIPEGMIDLEPTRETMSYRDVTKAPARAVEKQRVSAEDDITLSMQAKIIIAVISAIVLIAFTVIFVNSALLSSLNAELEVLEATVSGLAEQASALEAQVNAAKSEETIRAFAEMMGMIKG